MAALQRLYSSQLKFDEELRQLKQHQAKTHKELDRLGGYIRETAEIVRLTNEQMQHTDARLDQLVGIVKSHEDRLQRLEGRPH